MGCPAPDARVALEGRGGIHRSIRGGRGRSYGENVAYGFLPIIVHMDYDSCLAVRALS